MSSFKEDVRRGLSGTKKYLSSKYFYDEIGDQLFVEIMNLPEYYLTRSEHEILRTHAPTIIDKFAEKTPFSLIELGAGDGTKTLEILKALSKQNTKFAYRPVDISEHAIHNLEKRLNTELSDIEVSGIVGDYFQVLSEFDKNEPKAILFLGSNIGNMTDDVAKGFMEKLSQFMNSGDHLLVGFDLIKSKDIVLPAYNDSQGITKQFNLNLLTRMNKELGADFKLEQWEHAPDYNETTGLTTSAIKSTCDQQVYFETLGERYTFKKDELIHTEISRKYNLEIIHQITENCDFQICADLRDQKGYFTDIIFKKL